ncbi:MAG: carboxylesterase family protein, partial [Phaeodactylibacter sp.]|nr:carboxylesterase family protein [Phaeodactylibacter sp.]
MKQVNMTLLVLLMFAGAVQAQQRYLDEIFTDVTVTEDVFFGVNATVLLITNPAVGEAIPQPLYFDFYEPAGDDVTERPLVIYYHTGNFLPQPQACSITGNKDDLLVQDMATRLAKMGYVVAVPDYRLGWNPLGSTQDERVFTLINAAYRGVQDARTAVRYFKKEAAENGNPLGVDVDRITLWGQGTGGYISLASATLDAYTDVLLPKFTTVIGGIPIPMVIESINGDIYGTSVGVVPPGAPPPFTVGDTLCYPNHVGYDSDFQLCVNMGGALGDTSWL